MSEFKKLFRVKRILAMMLAVIVAVTSIPVTANAAPLEPQAETELTADDGAAEDGSVEDGVPDEPADDGQNVPSDESGGQDGDASASEGTDASSSPEDGSDVGGGILEGDSNADEGSDADSPTENAPETAEGTDGTDSTETTIESTEKEYAFEFSEDIAEYTEAEYYLGDALFATETEAADGIEAGMTVNASILGNITLRNVADKTDSYNLRYDSYADVVQTVTYAWKQDGKELDKGKSPRESGSYQLVIKLAAKEGAYKAAETTIDFQIRKAKVTVSYGVSNVDPGDLVSDVLLDYASAEASDGTYFTYETDDKSTDANEAADNEVAFDLTVKDAASNSVLQSDVKLVKNKEYVVNAAPKFVGAKAADYEKNYEFNRTEEQKITVNDLIATKVKLTLDAKYDSAQYKKESNISAKDSEQTIDKITIQSYDGNAVALGEPKYTAEVQAASGVDQAGEVSYQKIDKAVTKTAWHSAVYESWTEGGTGYCSLTVGGELEGAPTDAGFYVYRVSYDGDEEQYAASSADIVVEIAAVDLIIQPKFDVTAKSFFDGQTAADVLAKVTYELPYADGSTDKLFTIPADKKDSFWGTSFVNNLRTQPYEPVFEVVKKVGDKAEVLDEDDLLVYDEKGAVTYEVRFTGYKAVYNANGTEYVRKGINDPADSTNSNYVVKADQETLETYTAAFTVNNVNAVIDSSEVVGNFITNPDFHDAAGKTYDGARLFPNRADYKKAQLKAKDTNTVVPDVKSTDLTYKWYRSSYKTIMDTKVQNSEGIYEETADFANSFYAVNDFISPIDAGIYKLEISYKDKAGKYYAEPAEVYFVIEQQKLKIKLSDKEYSEFSGITVEQFLNDAEIEYSIEQELATPAVEWREYYSSGSGYPYTYTVAWQVEEKQRDADGNVLKDDKGNEIYNALQWYESFVYDKQYAADSYRLSVADFECYNSNYTVSEVTIETVDETSAAQSKVTQNLSINDDNTAKIVVEQMGSTVIQMEGMITKEKDYNGVSIYDVLKDDLANVKAVKENEDGTTTEVTDAPLTYIVTDHTTETTYELESLSEDEFNKWASNDQFINGGDYSVSVYCRGNAAYAPMDETVIADITVNRIPLKITPPALEDVFTAGTEAYQVTDQAAAAFGTADIEGYLERDKAYFNKSALYYMVNGQSYLYQYGYSAWYELWFDEDGECYWNYDLPYFSVYDKESQNILDGYEVLKGEGQNRYELILEDYNVGQLSGRCARNYDPVCGEASSLALKRGNATLQAVSYSNILDVDTTDSVNDMTHQFRVQDGINYTSFNKQEGNFVAVEIIAPAEYRDDPDIWNRAVYEASLTGDKSGGEIVRGSHSVGDGYAITVVFDASKGDAEFAIRWEEDYIETFKLEFSKATCLGNLDDAVSPKTIAFNAPNKTMVVGATQNLDVKITKVQKDDIICLGYEVTKGQEYLCVNEYGKVTALKAGGSATVTVYPMHLVDGVKVPIEGAGVKTASVTINVKDVTAPKISKVTPVDYSVTVQYPYVQDVDYNYGYRREIYVLEGKNLKEQVFQDKLAEMSNEQWEGIFAAAPVFLNNNQEISHRIYDAKKHSYLNTVQYTISGLQPNTDYTVYVRNVSAIRTLADGCQVTESAAGSVKGFTTTKAQVKGLEATLRDKTETGKEGIIGDGSLEWIEYGNGKEADVRLSEGSVQLQIKGYYESAAKDPAAEPIDANGGFDIDSSQPWLLPLSKDDKAYYVDPKISYYFWTYAEREGYYDAYTGKAVAAGDYYRSATSNLAAIDKKGKITLKQPGWIEIVAVDTTTGIWSNQVNILIKADADAVKGKTTTLQVGQSIRLENLLVYNEGKKVLDQAYYNTSGRIDRNGLKDQIEKDGYFRLSDNGYITAVKSKGNIRVDLMDMPLQKSAQVTIKSTDLAPVKNLKMVDVIDNRFTVQFERSPYAQAYRIEVKNARGTLIRSIYAEDYKVNGLYYPYYDEDGNYIGDIYDNDSDWDDDYRQGDWHCYYDRKTRRTYGEYTIRGLTQQSKYSVTVQALYEDVSSKVVSKGVTTTKLPASERDLARGDSSIDIYVWNYNGYTISSHPFVSGNDYTLVAEPDNWGAKYAATDTLIWSSSNTKAATIKANAGSYSATLKAVRNGATTITVKSKITKKVIASYGITVRNVGDAYSVNEYYGDNEDLRGDRPDHKPACTELTLGNPGAVDLGSGQSQWFAFTAPEDGTYNFYRIQNGTKFTSGFVVRSSVPDGSYMGSSVNMAEGQTVYVQATATGSYTINVEKKKGAGVSDRTPLEIGSVTMQVTNGQYFVFTAEGEGLYRFSGLTFRVEDTEGNQKTQGNPARCWLDDGETVYLCASGSGQSTITVEKVPVQSLTADSTALDVKTDDYGNAWFYFTAPKAAEYEFVLSRDWNSKHIYLYNRSDLSNSIAGDWEYIDTMTLSYMLGSGTTVLIEAGSSDNKLEVKTKAAVESVNTGEDKNITLTASKQYFEFAAPTDGFYRFTSSGANGVEAVLYKDLTGTPVEETSNYSGDFVMTCYLKSGQHAYLVAKSTDGSEQADVAIKMESYTPGAIREEESEAEVAAYADEWFSYTASEDEKYTFTFTSAGYCGFSLYTSGALGADQPVPVKEFSLSYSKKYYDYEMTAGQTVYWKVKNSSYSNANVTVMAAKYTIPVLEEGSGYTDFDIETKQAQILMFTAAEAGKYTFKLRSNISQSIRGYLYKDASLTDSVGDVWIYNAETTYAYNAEAGETLYWKIDNTAYYDVTVSMSVEKFTINSMVDGSNTISVSGSSEKYYSYTAPEDGEYIFAFKSNSGYGYANMYLEMYFESSVRQLNFSSSYTKSTYTLSAQQTVYWKIGNNSSYDMEVTALVKKNVPEEITADGASAEVAYGLEQWFSFTADEDARYRFTLTSDTSYCRAYFYRDQNGSYEGSYVSLNPSMTQTDERYIEAGTTVYWKAEITFSYYAPTNVTIKAEKVPMSAVVEGADASPVITNGQTRWFDISVPDSDAEYIITMITTDAQCYVELYADLLMSGGSIRSDWIYSGDGNSKNWTVSGNESGKVYLKVTNNDSSNDTRFKVAVKKRTEETISGDSNAVTVAPGAEQWFSFTSAEDGMYNFSLNSDTEECTWYRYDGDNLSSDTEHYTATNKTSKEVYIPQGSVIRWKVTNQSAAEITSITIVANAIEIQEIGVEEMQPVGIASGTSKWFSFSAEEAGRYGFAFTSVSASWRVYVYEELESGQRKEDFSVSSAVDKDYYVSETIYFKVDNTTGTDAEFAVNIAAYTVVALEADVEASFEDVKVQWYEFTAAQAGIYSFNLQSSSYQSSRRMRLYEKLSDASYFGSEVNNTGSVERSMEAGETVYLKIYSNNNSTVAGTLTATSLTVPELKIDTDEAISLTNQKGFAKFSVDETGIYTFKPVASDADTTGNGYIYLYSNVNDRNSLQYLYFNLSSSTDKLIYPLMAGDTVYVCVDRSALTEVKVSVAKENPMEELTVDQTYSLSLKQGEEKWVCFRASEEQYQHYMNASWSGGIKTTIKYVNLNGTSPYSALKWKDKMQTIIKYESLDNENLYSYYSEKLCCICISSLEDNEMTFSITTAAQN